MSEEKQKPKRKSMRKFYEEQTGRKLPDNFDIHHLDFNPENNDISNLLALPRKVHSDYHINLDRHREIKERTFYFDPKEKDFYMEYPIEFLKEDLKKILKMGEIYSEMCHWFNFKSFLMGKFPVPTGGCFYD